MSVRRPLVPARRAQTLPFVARADPALQRHVGADLPLLKLLFQSDAHLLPREFKRPGDGVSPGAFPAEVELWRLAAIGPATGKSQ